ncbi:MAG: hypothetical protein R2712_16895 [Vicinamibacterales bacterium]
MSKSTPASVPRRLSGEAANEQPGAEQESRKLQRDLRGHQSLAQYSDPPLPEMAPTVSFQRPRVGALGSQGGEQAEDDARDQRQDERA